MIFKTFEVIFYLVFNAEVAESTPSNIVYSCLSILILKLVVVLSFTWCAPGINPACTLPLPIEKKKSSPNFLATKLHKETRRQMTDETTFNEKFLWGPGAGGWQPRPIKGGSFKFIVLP
jgi:hypothetical protein